LVAAHDHKGPTCVSSHKPDSNPALPEQAQHLDLLLGYYFISSYDDAIDGELSVTCRRSLGTMVDDAQLDAFVLATPRAWAFEGLQHQALDALEDSRGAERVHRFS